MYTVGDSDAATARPATGKRPLGSRCWPSCPTLTPSDAHCSVCHRTFGRVGGFDRHRSDGWCIDPGQLDMVINTRGRWVSPMSAQDAARLQRRSHPRE